MASRKEEKEQRRQERLAAEQAAQDKHKKQRTYGIVAGSVLVVAVVIAVIVVVTSGGSSDKNSSTANGYGPEAKFASAVTPPAVQEEDLAKAAKTAGCVIQNPPIEGSEHIESSKPVKYKTDPPTSGNHDVLAQPDGVYSAYPQPRHVVHALEGGRVTIQYNPKLVDKQQIDTLGGIYDNDSLYLVMFPNPEMPYAVATSAWGHLAGCKKVTDATYDVVRAFIDRYRAVGPEDAASHQPAVNGQDWPGPVPPQHKQGAVSGS